jgi:ketosteroid isomerase-like protein
VSRENVELMRERFAEVARTGAQNPDWYHPDIRWHLRADLPDSETLVGRERVLRLYDEWGEIFDHLRFDVDELIDAGGDQVVAVLRLRGAIKDGGQEIDMPETWVIKVVDGMNVETSEYATKAEALKAVGLEE